MLNSPYVLAMAGFALLILSDRVEAQIDSLQVVVSNQNAIGTFDDSIPPLAAFGYDPVHDRMYVASGQGINQQLRLIENVSGNQSVSTLVYATPWTLFGRGGNPDYGGGNPVVGGLLLNPKPIESLNLGSYSNAWIMDGAAVVTSGSNPTVNHQDLTQRLYRFNLQESTTGNASDVFTSILTLSQFQAAAQSSSNITNSARQFGWSGDGQSLYFVDTTSSAGGIWKMPAAGGTPKRLFRGATDLNTEPAVLSAGSIDAIFFKGTGSTSGGIDKITTDGTNTSARTIALAAATIKDFLELPGGGVNINAMAADADGNLYWNNTGTSRQGIYRWDTNGRLSKVVDMTEKQAAFSLEPLTINAFRMQPRLTTFTSANGTIPVTQLLYVDNSVSGYIDDVAGAFVFKPGDFNRDNQVNQQDIQLFKNALTPKSVIATTANLKFDLNGNDEVSWKDVKILQQFYPFPDGDANMDRVVDLLDLLSLATHWQVSGQTWIDGDFTGDGLVNASDLGVLSAHWQNSSNSIPFSEALTEVGWAALVPEPSIIPSILLAVASCVTLRRRRNPTAHERAENV